MSDEVAARHRRAAVRADLRPRGAARRAGARADPRRRCASPSPTSRSIRLYAAAYHRGELTMHASPSLFGGTRHRRPRPRRGRPTSCRPTCSPTSRRPPEPDVTLVVAHKGGIARQEGARHPQEGRRPGHRRPGDQDRPRQGRVRRQRVPPARPQGHRRGGAARSSRPSARTSESSPAACQQLVDDTDRASSTSRWSLTYHGGKVEATGFRVADAAMAGDTGEALRLLRHAIAVGVDPVPIVAVLAQQLRQLIKVGSAGRGRSADLARDLGMAPWQVDKARRAARAAGPPTALGRAASRPSPRPTSRSRAAAATPSTPSSGAS